MKLKLRFLLVLLVCLFLANYSNAQEDKTKKYELGIITSSLSSYGFIYKQDFKENSMLRISSSSFGLNITPAGTQSNTFGIVVGTEKRKNLTEKVTYSRGPEVGIFANQSYNTRNQDYDLGITPRLIYYWGLSYELTEDFYVGGEIRPSLGGAFQVNNRNNDLSNFRFDLDLNTRVRLHLVYKL